MASAPHLPPKGTPHFPFLSRVFFPSLIFGLFGGLVAGAVLAHFFLPTVLELQRAVPTSFGRNATFPFSSERTVKTVSVLVRDGEFVGRAVALSEDGWFVTARSAAGGSLRTLTLVQNNRTLRIERRFEDAATGLSFVKTEDQGLIIPRSNEGFLPSVGEDLWYADPFAGFISHRVAHPRGSVEAPAGESFVDSKLDRFILLDGGASATLIGSPVFAQDGALVGIVTGSNALEQPVVVPIGYALSGFREIVQHGHIARPTIGVRILNEPSDGVAGVVRVHTIIPHGPAAASSLASGDGIIAINDEEVVRERTLAEILLSLSSGDIVTVRFLRGIHTREVKVTLDE